MCISGVNGILNILISHIIKIKYLKTFFSNIIFGEDAPFFSYMAINYLSILVGLKPIIDITPSFT